MSSYNFGCPAYNTYKRTKLEGGGCSVMSEKPGHDLTGSEAHPLTVNLSISHISG